MGLGRPSADEVADFEAYVHARGAHLGRVARLLAQDREDAEDLLQSALARALASWARVRASDDVDAYVGRILVNTHLTALRRRPREVSAQTLPDTPGTRPRDSVGLADDRQVLVAALRRLPPRQRVTVVLRYYADLSESETAAALGCTVGTVRSQASRGLAALRAAMAATGVRTATAAGGTGTRR